MTNVEIRLALRQTGVRQWELAERLKVSEWTLCRRLRHELPPERKQEALEAVRVIEREKREAR